MKYRAINCLFILAIPIVLVSCKNKNYVNSTEVFNDGSCYRTMSLTGDSSIALSTEFPILIDSSWETNTEFVNKEENSYRIKVSKTFKNVSDMNLEKPNDSVNWSILEHSFHLEKKFRWLYTYLTFKETYKKINPFELIPVSDYISQDELLVLEGENTEYLAGRDSAQVEKIRDQITGKAFTWIQASIFEEFNQLLIANLTTIGNPAIHAKSIQESRDTVLNYLQLKEGNISEVLFDVDSMLKIYSICLNSNDFEKLSPGNSKIFDGYIKKGEKLDLMFNMMSDSENNTVTMPGLLISTNCKTLVGNKIEWEFNPLKCFFKDFEITITSRVYNRWAFVVGAALFMFLIAGLVIGVFVKRRR